MDGLAEDARVFRETYFALYNQRNGTRYGDKPIPKFDGGTSKTGRVYKSPIWSRLVCKLRNRNIPVIEYLEFVMSNFDIQYPNCAVTDRYMDAYEDSVKLNFDTLRTQLDCQYSILDKLYRLNRKIEGSDRFALAKLLSDTSIGVSPLVKCYFAASNGYADLIGSGLEKDAWDQFSANRTAYLQCYVDKIPEAWRRDV